MPERTVEIVRRLADRAEEVCRHYLSNGRRVGGYWIVGDCRNARGRSLYVRLKPNAQGAAGKWTDAALGQHGDMLDIIASAIGSHRHQDTVVEAERFLGMARLEARSQFPRASSVEAAQRLFDSAKPVIGTPALRYLAARGINARAIATSRPIRFHARCYYRRPNGEREEFPALLAAITDNHDRITGVLRTYLSSEGSTKAPIESPRRALGQLAGNGVRFGPHAEVMAVGEGVETMLSLRMAMPQMSIIAALSAAHLGAWISPATLRRLYIAVDRDDAGRNAAARLHERLKALGIGVLQLHPRRKDFNDDLIADGVAMLRAQIADQLLPDDCEEFIEMISGGGAC